MSIIVIAYAIGAAYDFTVNQFIASPDTWPRFRDIFSLLPWYAWVIMVLILVAVALCEGGYRASRNRDRTIAELRRALNTPVNKDALIAAFTELGARAQDLISNLSSYEAFVNSGMQTGDNLHVFEKFRKDNEDARTKYEEAKLVTEKEINILGGNLGRRLDLLMGDIQRRVWMEPSKCLNESVFRDAFPTISETVNESLRYIRGEKQWYDPYAVNSPYSKCSDSSSSNNVSRNR